MTTSKFRRWSKEIWIYWNLSIIFSVATSHPVEDNLDMILSPKLSLAKEDSSSSDTKSRADVSIELSHAQQSATAAGTENVLATTRHLSHQVSQWFPRMGGVPTFPGNMFDLEERGGRTTAISFLFLLPSIILELAYIGALVVFSPFLLIISSFLSIITYSVLL